jgi:hypothetical protein
LQQRGAESGAQGGAADPACSQDHVSADVSDADPDLTTIVQAWPTLPAEVKASVVAILRLARRG